MNLKSATPGSSRDAGPTLPSSPRDAAARRSAGTAERGDQQGRPPGQATASRVRVAGGLPRAQARSLPPTRCSAETPEGPPWVLGLVHVPAEACETLAPVSGRNLVPRGTSASHPASHADVWGSPAAQPWNRNALTRVLGSALGLEVFLTLRGEHTTQYVAYYRAVPLRPVSPQRV